MNLILYQNGRTSEFASPFVGIQGVSGGDIKAWEIRKRK